MILESPMKLNRAACERRAYRLATLLTGDPVAAMDVVEAMVRAQPDLRVLDTARLDRLTVLRSREITPGTPGRLPADVLGADAAGALDSLATQPREAWLLARTYGLSPRETARAMDCSVTATARHVERADDVMARMLGGSDGPCRGVVGAIEALRVYSGSLALPPLYLARQRRRRRRRQLLAMVLLVATALAVMAIAGRLSPG